MWTILPSHLPRPLLLLFLLEALLVGTMLILFTRGYPETTRMILWKEGGIKRFNSNPALRIYFYANHKEPPPIPYIWARTSSDFNLAVAILNACVFMARSVLQYSNLLEKWTETFLQSVVLPFWFLCIAGQRSGDFSDVKHISYSPWYLSMSCAAASPNAQTACRIAQASFGMTIVTASFYSFYVWRIISFAFFEYWLNRSWAQKRPVRPVQAEIPMVQEEICSDEDDYSENGNLLPK